MARADIFYVEGRGVDAVDFDKAMHWYRKASEEDDQWSTYRRGYLHENGLGAVSKNDETALKWYRKGATLGSPEAICMAKVAAVWTSI